MTLIDSTFTANIGVCVQNDQNLKKLTELSGMPLIRARSFLIYYLKQSSNISLILDFASLNESMTLTHLSCTNNLNLDSEYFFNQLETKSISLITNVDIFRQYRVTKLRKLILDNQECSNLLKKVNQDDIVDGDFIAFATCWLNSQKGLEYTAYKIGALFNVDGAIYYDRENIMLNEHNCPLIPSLLG